MIGIYGVGIVYQDALGAAAVEIGQNKNNFLFRIAHRLFCLVSLYKIKTIIKGYSKLQ